jgi:hypothetical protein
MGRQVAGAVFALIVALGCSACGSTHTIRSTATTKATHAAQAAPIDLPPGTNFVILPPTHGVGNGSLGTFTVAGRYGNIAVQCTGEGPIRVAGLWTVPCNFTSGQLGFDTAGKRIHLTVRAKPGTTWWLAAGEHIPALVHRPVVLLHRAGVGSKSLGTFHPNPHGMVKVVTTCKGKGQFNVRPTSWAQGTYFPWELSYCPAIRNVTTSHPPAGVGGVPISVQAGRKAHWTITISETTVGASTSSRR